ncbi:MAG: LiaF transmembrane domain-containing protein [Erysipelotrichaceae bacterium]
MKKVSFNIIAGIALIVVGIGYFGNAFFWWDFSIFFDGWWTLFLIIPSLYIMLKNGIRVWNFAILGAGVYYLLREQRLINFRITWPMLFALGLIFIGVQLIFSSRHNRESKVFAFETSETHKGASYQSTCLFSTKSVALHEGVDSAHLESIFGNFELDLTRCDLRACEGIELEAVFGSLTIIVNQDVFVNLTQDNVFGRVLYNPNSDGRYPLAVKASAVFGQIKILTLLDAERAYEAHAMQQEAVVEVYIEV